MGDAQWSDEDSATFLKYGAAFVPRRAEQFRIVATLVAMSAPQLVVDLCCGEGHLSRALLEELPDVVVEGLDASGRMRRAAESALHSYDDRFRTAHFDVHEPWRDRLKPADAFVSSLALHHLTADEKAAAYADLRATLTPGGIFVNADLVMPPTAAGRALAAEAWDRSVRESPVGAEAFEAFESLRWNLFRYPDDNDTDYPLPIAQELSLLTAAGFVDVDVYWLYAGHAIWGGRAE